MILVSAENKSKETGRKMYSNTQFQLTDILNNFVIDKAVNRVPRAASLLNLKKIMLYLKDEITINELMAICEIGKRSYFLEYLKLLDILGWAHYKNDFIISTSEGEVIKSKLSKTEFITDNDCQIIRREFLKLGFIRKFMLVVFNFDITNRRLSSGVCLTKDEITKKYLEYRKVSQSVVERESRLIYNWLLGLKVLETLPIIDKYKDDKVCYHVIGAEVSFEKFTKRIKPTVFRAINGKRKPSEWVEIPKVRNLFCIENDISKSQFDKLFLAYIKKYPETFQLSTATTIRPEVEREGIKSNNSIIYFYVKLSEDR